MTAVELGHEYVALTDHSPRLKVANGLSAARLAKQLDVLEAVNGHLARPGSGVLAGIEVDILDDGGLDQTEELLGRLDVVVASVHSKLRMEPGPMTRRMLGGRRATRARNVLGHCTGRLVTGGRGTRPQSEFDAEAVFTACRRPRRRGGDQQPARAAGPARRPLALAVDDRVRVLDRLRRPRAGAAGLPRPRRRPRRRGSACPWSASSPPGRSTTSSPGPRRAPDPRRRRYGRRRRRSGARVVLSVGLPRVRP